MAIGGKRTKTPTSQAPKKRAPRAKKSAAAERKRAPAQDAAEAGAGEETEAVLDPEVLEPAPEELEEADAELEGDLSVPPVTALARAPEAGLTRKDPLQAYMAEVTRHPLLSRDEELRLARHLRATGDVQAAYRLVA